MATEKKNMVGPTGPICCNQRTKRVRFFDSAENTDKANADGSTKGMTFVGYQCQGSCKTLRVGETEEAAAARFSL